MSSLSSSIRALERELGSDLFVRSTRRVELTAAGRALLPAAQRTVQAAEDGRDAVAGVRGLVRGQLAVGVIQSQTVGAINVPALLARYHRRHPDVTLALRHTGVASLVHQTADGELDLANRSRVRLLDLTNRDFVEYRSDSSLRASIDHACQAAGLQRRIACEADTIADLVELVALGLGVSLLPPAAIRMAGERALGLATDPSIPQDLMLVTPVDREPSPAGAAFLDLLDSDPQTAA